MNIETILRGKGHGTYTIPPETTIEETAHIMADHNIGIVIIADGQNAIEGVLSERDIIKAVAHHGADVCKHYVRAFMTKDVMTCTPDEHPHNVLVRMNDHNIRHMPVLKDDKLKGMISTRDIVRYLALYASPDEQAFMWAKMFSV